MAAIHDLLKQIPDNRLRERIAREWDAATKHKKFGLVYERHLPELVPLWSALPRRGDLVALRAGKLTDTWRVRRVEGASANLLRRSLSSEREGATEQASVPVAELVVVKQFGEPVFPTLTPLDAVRNGPESAPWHALIEADNYHALQLLEYFYAGSVDCIYIDPPYNTGARDWKYNNDYVDSNDTYRHSKWLSFMEKRLKIAKKLLRVDKGVLICTIDEHEVHHLMCLLEQLLPEYALQLVTIVINQKGVSQGRLSRVEEYAVFCFSPNVNVLSNFDDLLTPQRREEKRFQPARWERLQRGGNNATPDKRSGLFYPIMIDPKQRRVVGIGKPLAKGSSPESSTLGDPMIAWPIRRDGSYATWQVGPSRLMKLLDKGFLRVGGYDDKRKTWSMQYLGSKAERQIEEGTLSVVGRDDALGCVIVEYSLSEEKSIKTVWHRQAHDSGIYGSSVLRSILGRSASFTFPKSIYSTRDAIAAIVRDRPRAIVVDFFAGSGTTLNSLNLLNASDGGQRQCVLVTNNEVAAEEAKTLTEQGHRPGDLEWEARGICKSITWPRSKFTILGRRDDGTPLAGDYSTGRTLERETSRRYQQLSFAGPSNFRLPDRLNDKAQARATKEIVKRQKALVALIDGLPQNAVSEGCRFIASEDHKAAVLFDPDATEDWLAALDGQDHIAEFFIVAETEMQFREIKDQIEELLGPQVIQEEEKRPMADGFATNLAYFKLDFLDKDRVELGAAFRDVLPILWMKAGAIGPMPELPEGTLPDWFAPAAAPFAVLLTEARINGFLNALKGRTGLSQVFIVTDAEEAFRALSDELRAALGESNPELRLVQLYRDYLTNFTINRRVDDASVAQGGEA
jgi:adenine-specific DNA-methyltransferase